MYEIEHRGVLTEQQYHSLYEVLTTHAENLGVDDKEVSYYIFPEKLLKVVNNLSRGTAVLSLKLTALGQGSAFKELEVPFDPKQFTSLNAICAEITAPQQIITGTQKRTNFMYSGIEIALKWSEDWGFHIELEKLIEDIKDKEAADLAIQDVANHFSITFMSEEEVSAFAHAVREKNKLL